MSELINNRENRQRVLKEMILELHNGKSVEEVKTRFEKEFDGVSASEISEMEQAIIQEGMPVQEIQRLCDVHASVFKGSIEEIHLPPKGEDTPGHPVYTFRYENREMERLIYAKILPGLESFRLSTNMDTWYQLNEAFEALWEIDKHYSRKENLLFPLMEKHDITAPPKVMWGVDDEIRALIKETRKLLESLNFQPEKVYEKGKETIDRVQEMIFKEENILFPMVLETFSEEEWGEIADASDEIGYCLIQPEREWRPILSKTYSEKAEELNNGAVSEVCSDAAMDVSKENENIHFDAGQLTPEEINAMLNTLPLDITFVDKDGAVKYFTQGKERIFARAKTILGRKVENCHPPKSVHIVEKIVEDLRSGKKDHEDFWIKLGNQYAYIRYYAVRNAQGEYLGVMELTQDIQPIQAITGEKRLMSE